MIIESNISDDASLFIKIVNACSRPYVVLDLGSRDGRETRRFAEQWPWACVYGWECNPDALQTCRDTIAGCDNAGLVEMAATSGNEPITFHPVTSNPGASSRFIPSGDYDRWERYTLGPEVTVPAARIDTWAAQRGITQVDAIWADLQGGELDAFIGAGKLMDTVSVVQAEVSYREMYTGQPLFADVVDMLRSVGLVLVAHSELFERYWGDAIFVREPHVETARALCGN